MSEETAGRAAERETNSWRKVEAFPVYARLAAAEPVGLREAAQAVIDGKFSTYKARNGRDVGIQGDDGEKVWLVHSDEIFALETALSHPAPANMAGTRGGSIRSAIAGLLKDTLPIAGETYDADGRAELQSAIMDLVDALIWREAPVSVACDGIADDYMTSETHHPGHVLIPAAKFEQIVAALATPARTDDAAQAGGDLAADKRPDLRTIAQAIQDEANPGFGVSDLAWRQALAATRALPSQEVEPADWRDDMLGYAYQFIGVISSDMSHPAVQTVLDAFAEPGPDKVAMLPALIESPRQCPSSPDCRHQVDTSMESGPNNCFHCEQPMPGWRMPEGGANG